MIESASPRGTTACVDSSIDDVWALIDVGPLIPIADGPARDNRPERWLVLAVLSDALLTLFGPAHAGPLARHEATRWLLGGDSRPFGAAWCCQHLGVEYQPLRLAVHRMLTAGVSRQERRRLRWLGYSTHGHARVAQSVPDEAA